MEVYNGMTGGRLSELLEKIKDVKVGLLGDLGLDVYWQADMTKSELSRETPHFPLPIVEERASPGAGGNVAANLAALCPQKVWAVSAVGTDWRGQELLKLLTDAGVDVSHVARHSGMVTNAYIKPLRQGVSQVVYEDPRLDFTNYAPLGEAVEDAIIASLDGLAPRIDVLCVSDQFAFGVVTDRVREHLKKLAQEGLTVVVDSRERIGRYEGAILKPNEVEGMRAMGVELVDSVSAFADAALSLSSAKGCQVLMTIGSKGALYADGQDLVHIPAHSVNGEIDIVGAGDTFLSGFSLATAAGASRPEAAYVAGLCSGVTIQQIGTTGVATPEQIWRWHEKCTV